MTDILLRLGELRYPPHDQSADPYADACEDAREEIVALRAEADALKGAVEAYEADAVAYRAEVERLRADRKILRSALVRAHDAMGSVTVFITSRERIKQPEGEAWWDEECGAVESALDSTVPSPGASHGS